MGAIVEEAPYEPYEPMESVNIHAGGVSGSLVGDNPAPAAAGDAREDPMGMDGGRDESASAPVSRTNSYQYPVAVGTVPATAPAPGLTGAITGARPTGRDEPEELARAPSPHREDNGHEDRGWWYPRRDPRTFYEYEERHGRPNTEGPPVQPDRLDGRVPPGPGQSEDDRWSRRTGEPEVSRRSKACRQ